MSEVNEPRLTAAEKKEAAVKKRNRLQRDTGIIIFTLMMAAFEIMFGGARASVFTFLGGLLISPLVMRYDERRREESNE